MSFEGVYQNTTGDLLRAAFGGLVAGVGETKRTDNPFPAKVRGDSKNSTMHRWNGSAWIEVANVSKPGPKEWFDGVGARWIDLDAKPWT